MITTITTTTIRSALPIVSPPLFSGSPRSNYRLPASLAQGTDHPLRGLRAPTHRKPPSSEHRSTTCEERHVRLLGTRRELGQLLALGPVPLSGRDNLPGTGSPGARSFLLRRTLVPSADDPVRPTRKECWGRGRLSGHHRGQYSHECEVDPSLYDGLRIFGYKYMSVLMERSWRRSPKTGIGESS